jgi:hypothetical protein
MRRSAVLALLFLVAASVCAETLTVSGGSSTFGAVTGSKWQVTGAQVAVSTTETVNANITATVQYRVGRVINGTFMESFKYERNLTAGANQAVSNTFTALSQGVEYTVKFKTTYSDSTANQLADRTFTVSP